MAVISQSPSAPLWEELFSGEDREAGEVRLFASLFDLFSVLAGNSGFTASRPGFVGEMESCRARLAAKDAEAAETALAGAYAALHGADKIYSPEERRRLDELGGYWCHAGGFSPLWRAAPYIGPETRLADYGAGNGLQGFLFQHLYPHRKTTLIELSGPMVARGREIQRALGLPAEKVEWVHGSVEDVPPSAFDFIYIYRPLKPEREAGRRFYERFARDLAASEGRKVIFSIADCLQDFLDSSFAVFYDDGQLTCFLRE